MDSSYNPEALAVLKKESVESLKKYLKHLSNKYQELENCLTGTQKRNEALHDRSQQLTNNSLTAPTKSTETIPNITLTSLETCKPDLTNKLKQLQSMKETVSATFEEQTKSSQQKYFEILTKDEIFLKPYHDVEEATKNIEQKIEIISKQREQEKVNFLDNLKEREQDFIQLKKQITDWEPIEKELRLEDQNCKTTLEQKFKSLSLKSTEEASADSFNSKELLKEISDLKSQLY